MSRILTNSFFLCDKYWMFSLPLCLSASLRQIVTWCIDTYRLLIKRDKQYKVRENVVWIIGCDSSNESSLAAHGLSVWLELSLKMIPDVAQSGAVAVVSLLYRFVRVGVMLNKNFTPHTEDCCLKRTGGGGGKTRSEQQRGDSSPVKVTL